MILNRNKSLGVKNDKILWVQSLKKHPEGWKWRMEKRKKKRRKERERDYWCFFPRRPCSRVRISVLFSLFVPFSLLSSSYFSSVTLLLSHLVVFTLPRVYTLTYSSFHAFLLEIFAALSLVLSLATPSLLFFFCSLFHFFCPTGLSFDW